MNQRVLKYLLVYLAQAALGQDSTMMGKHSVTHGAAGMGSDTDAA